VKSAPSGVEKRYTMCLPYVSEIGAAMTGPSPSASTYVVRGRSATVVLMPNCFWRAGTAGETTEEPKELFVMLDIVFLRKRDNSRCKRYYCGRYDVHNLFSQRPVVRVFRIIGSIPIERSRGTF
jgi:hypothetical protein